MPRGVKEHWDEEMLARAAGMKRAGMTNKDIAARLGVSVGSVIGRMSRAGAKRRLDGRGGRSRAISNRRTLDNVGTIIDQKAGIED
jgi:transposase